MNPRRFLFGIPLGIFIVMLAYFAVGLTKDPHRIESVLINQPFPELDLPPMPGHEGGFSTADLKGQVTLVNVWGSWCVACRAEHPFLVELTEGKTIPIYGIDWRERSPTDGPEWLRRLGNPYLKIGYDPESHAAIALGVTGAPETFVVDKKGVIRYKQIGPLLPEVWQQTIAPIVEELRRE